MSDWGNQGIWHASPGRPFILGNIGWLYRDDISEHYLLTLSSSSPVNKRKWYEDNSLKQLYSVQVIEDPWQEEELKLLVEWQQDKETKTTVETFILQWILK